MKKLYLLIITALIFATVIGTMNIRPGKGGKGGDQRLTEIPATAVLPFTPYPGPGELIDWLDMR